MLLLFLSFFPNLDMTKFYLHIPSLYILCCYVIAPVVQLLGRHVTNQIMLPYTVYRDCLAMYIEDNMYTKKLTSNLSYIIVYRRNLLPHHAAVSSMVQFENSLPRFKFTMIDMLCSHLAQVEIDVVSKIS